MSNQKLGKKVASAIKKLDYIELNDLATILRQGDQLDCASQIALVVPKLKNYQIEFLGGGNSKNFKITNPENGDVTVLKIDFPVNSAKQNPVKKAATVLDDVIVHSYLDKAGIQVTDYVSGGSLLTHANNLSAAQRQQQAASIFRQMADAVERLGAAEIAHTDMKNSNWLIENGRLKITDTKALLATRRGKINGGRNVKVVRSPGFIPKEFVTSDIPAIGIPTNIQDKPSRIPDYVKNANTDQVHAYLLGKNIYQFLTNSEHEQEEVNAIRAEIKQLHEKRNEKMIQYNELRSKVYAGEASRKALQKSEKKIRRLGEKIQTKQQQLKEADVMSKMTYDESDFSHPVFEGVQGEQYKALIQALVQENPKHRMSLADAKQQLAQISCLSLIAEIDQKLAAVEEKKLGDKDTLMADFIEMQQQVKLDFSDDLEQLQELNSSLEEVLDSLNSENYQEVETAIVNSNTTKLPVIRHPKAVRIEDVLRKVPVEERGQGRDNPSIDKAIRQGTLKSAVKVIADNKGFKQKLSAIGGGGDKKAPTLSAPGLGASSEED